MATDENVVAKGVPAVSVKVQQTTRAALGDVSNNTRKTSTLKGKAVDHGPEKPAPVVAHRRTSSATATVTQRQPLAARASITSRPPIRPGRSISSVLANSKTNASGAPVRPLPSRARTLDSIAVGGVASQRVAVTEEVEMNQEVDTEPEDETTMEDVEEAEEPVEDVPSSQRSGAAEDEEMDEDDWTFASPKTNAKYQAAVEQVKATFKDEIDEFDMTMVSEYADEIFAYMGKLEVSNT